MKFILIGVKESYDCGLKLFLDKDSLERLNDFEEESMEGLVREREAKHNQTTEERIRLIGQRLDGLNSKYDDSHHPDNALILVDSLESRLNLLERAIERATNTCIALNDYVISQESFRQSSGEKTASVTPSEATTVILASALDGEKWTSSSLHSDTSSNNSDDEQIECNESEHGDTIAHKDSFPITLASNNKLVRRASTSHLLNKKVTLIQFQVIYAKFC